MSPSFLSRSPFAWRAALPAAVTGALVLLFLHTVLTTAQAGTLAARLQAAYAAVDTMRTEFTQELTHKESGSREKRSGVLLFKKPLLVRWETQKPSPELLVVGKKAIWNVFPDEELAYKYSLAIAEDSGGIIKVVTGQARLDQDYDLEDEGRDGDLVTVRLYPRQPSQSLVEAALWIDPATWLIKKIRVFDFYGNENEITFTRQETGASVKDERFDYAPPGDFLVEDRTSRTELDKPLLQ